MRREAASIKIQKNTRKYQARNKYNKLRVSILALQMTLRTMAARKECLIRRQNKVATLIQVHFHNTNNSSIMLLFSEDNTSDTLVIFGTEPMALP